MSARENRLWITGVVCGLIAIGVVVVSPSLGTAAPRLQGNAGFCRIAEANKLAERAGLLNQRRSGVRLLTNRQSVEMGEAVTARLANFSNDTVVSGAEFKIQRFDGTAWRTDPSSPDGPWPRRARKLKPGEVAGCYRYVVPEAQPPGQYRFLTSIEERTEQYSKRYYKASEFFIRDMQGRHSNLG